MEVGKYTIGEVSKITGVNIKTLQRWTDKKITGSDKNQDLLNVEVTERGYRLFSKDDVEKILLINLYRNFGLSYNKIREILKNEKSLEEILNEHKFSLKKQIEASQKIQMSIDTILKEDNEDNKFFYIQKLSQDIAPDLNEMESLCTEQDSVIFIDNFKWIADDPLMSCLSYLRYDISKAWMKGSDCFILNIREDAGADAPEKWWDGDSGRFRRIKENAGIYETIISSYRGYHDFEEKQKEAFEKVKQAIDNKIPCYGWELEECDYYIIKGYDDIGYYYSDRKTKAIYGPKPWNEVACTDWGVLEFHIVNVGAENDVLIQLKDVFEFVFDHGKNFPGWIHKGYKSGISGYDNWILALERNLASYHGVLENILFWQERRRLSIDYLKEANKRTNYIFRGFFDDSIELYKKIYGEYNELEKLYIDSDKEKLIYDKALIHKTINILHGIKIIEKQALESLKKILMKIYQVLFPKIELSFEPNKIINIKKIYENEISDLTSFYLKNVAHYDINNEINQINFEYNEIQQKFIEINTNIFHYLISVTMDEEILGFACGKIEKYKNERNKTIRKGIITDFFLLDDFFRIELIEKMEGALHSFFKINKVDFIEISFNPHMKKYITFFNKMNYKEWKVVFYKK